MSPRKVSPAAGGVAELRPAKGSRAALTQRDLKPEKDYVVILAPTQSRNGWVATVEKNGVPLEGVRVVAPSYRGALDGALKALRQRVRRGLIDNVAWRLKVSAHKRRAVERVQPAYNAAFGAYVAALKARRTFLRAARRAVEVLRDDGFSEADLAEIALSLPSHVRTWLASDGDPKKTGMWEAWHVSEWLMGEALDVLRYSGALKPAAKAPKRGKGRARKPAAPASGRGRA